MNYIIAILLLVIIAIVAYLLKFYLFYLKISKQVKYQEPDVQARFSQDKIPQQIDHIIIGSGIGGLICGALLSKLGRKVVILEQHNIVGGCCHSFQEKGYTFDTGIHYLGHDQTYEKVLNLACAKPIVWNVFKCYDLIKLADGTAFPLCAPESEYTDNLIKTFPEASAQIQLFMGKMKKGLNLVSWQMGVAALLPSYLQVIINAGLKLYYNDIYNKSTQQVLKDIGLLQNKKLTTILCSQYGDLGVGPDKCPFTLQCLLTNHYLKGSMYPKEGTIDIVKSIAGTICSTGGCLLTHARVQEILIENGKVIGVKVGDKEIKCSRGVISGIGLPHTAKLIPQKIMNESLQQNKKIVNVPYKEGISHFYCFIGLKKCKIPLPTYNIWDHSCSKDCDLIEDRKDYLDQMNWDKMLIFTAFSSAKMKDESEKQSCVMVGEARSEWVEKYKVNEVQRKEGYKEFKDKVQAMFMKNFKKNFPELVESIDYIDVATPLTNEHYLSRYASYGMEMTTDRFSNMDVFCKSQSDVEGLYFTGQDVVCSSFSGSTMSGLLTAMKVAKVI